MVGPESGSWRLCSQEQDSDHFAVTLLACSGRDFLPHPWAQVLALPQSRWDLCHPAPFLPHSSTLTRKWRLWFLLPHVAPFWVKFHAACLIWEALVTCLHSSCRRGSESDSGFCLGEAALKWWCILQTWVCSQTRDYSQLLSHWHIVGWLGSWSALWISEPFYCSFLWPFMSNLLLTFKSLPLPYF